MICKTYNQNQNTFIMYTDDNIGAGGGYYGGYSSEREHNVLRASVPFVHTE